MELINGRYKIEDIYEEQINGMIYIVRDLYESNKRVLLKLLNTSNDNKKVINYFIDNYLLLAGIKHDFILSNYSFNIVNTIDNKKVKKNQYFYTKEYSNNISLKDTLAELSSSHLIKIIQKIIHVVGYLHFRGITYRYISPDNIYIDIMNDDVNVKLADLASIIDRSSLGIDDYANDQFLAPEVNTSKELIDEKADAYSLASLISNTLVSKIISNNRSNNVEKYISNSSDWELLMRLLSHMTEADLRRRSKDFNKLLEIINKIGNSNYSIDHKRDREKLNFNTKIVGRSKEIESVLNLGSYEDNQSLVKHLVIVNGEAGIGKTRLVEEISYRLKIQGESVYYTTITDKDTGELKPIVKVLKQMIKNCDSSLINKYGSELIKLIPELRLVSNIKPSSALGGDKEKLRLFDRITSFISEFAMNQPVYIILDDFHNVDLETLYWLNFAIKNNKNHRIVFIVTVNKDRLEENVGFMHFYKEWTTLGIVEKIRPSKLNLDETAQLTRNILGINLKVINFSSRIMQVAKGNPRYIEETIKNLYAVGELFVDENGNWKTETKNYSQIYIPSDIDIMIKNQIDSIDRELFEVSKIISGFNTSVSKNIIGKIMGIDSKIIDELIEKLVSMKILDEMVEDWGYTYSFYNRQIKDYIYHNIPEWGKIALHKSVADILEEINNKEGRVNNDELIHHLTLSNQIDKAVDYAIEFAKKMQNLLVNSQAIILWENVRSILGDKVSMSKLEVLVNLGKLYSTQGQNDKAIKIYNEAFSCATKLNQQNYIAICKNSLGDIYYNRNDLETSEKYIIEAKKLAEEKDFIDGVLESVRLLNKINVSKGNEQKVIDLSKRYITIAKNNARYQFVAHYYNQMGVVNMFSGNITIAKKYFEKSIKYFGKTGERLESALPINNIGVMYSDYFDDLDKAMEYFNQGLSLCREFNSVQNEITFLINIGEAQIRKHQFEDALEMMERAALVANELDDQNNVFLVNLNLAIIYLHLGEYDRCFSHYAVVKDLPDKYDIEKQNISRFYNFLGLFYYRFGQWDQSIKYSALTKKNSFKLDQKQYLNSESILLMAQFYRDGNYDKNAIDELRTKYRDSHLNSDRRDSLLRFAQNAIRSGEIDYAYELLEEDKEVSKFFSSRDIEISREIIVSSLQEDCIDSLISIVNKCKKASCLEREQNLYQTLGDKLYKEEEFYEAASYYITAIDILYRLANKIPDEDMKLSYLESHGIEEVKKKLEHISNTLVCNKTSDEVAISSSNPYDPYNYFDLSTLEKLFNNDESFRNNIIYHNKSGNRKYRGMNDLISSFTTNYKSNLEKILEFIIQETFASRGYILAYNEENEDLNVLVSYPFNGTAPDIRDILGRVRQKKRGIIVSRGFKHKNREEYFHLADDIKSMLCMPIFHPSNNSYEASFDRRKDMGDNEAKSIVGYIYLDTDRIFNKFDNERFRQVETISNLAFVNIDNYYLKIISSLDKMTGTYTRKHFDIIFKDMINKAKKEKSNFCVIMCDVDRFKSVNDTFGHQKGDEVLSNIGSIILKNVRESDTVSRYGGEEFVIVLENTSEADGYLVAEKIRQKVEESKLIGPNYPLTISLGISEFPSHSQNKDELIEKADQALYQAKKLGRNKTIIWNSEIGSTTKRLDKLAGIVSGNTVEDQRHVLVMVEIIDLLKENLTKKDKIYKTLGRLIEIIAANQGILFITDNIGNITEIYGRQRFDNSWTKDPTYNKDIIRRVIERKSGEFLIDWEDISSIDIITGNPNWNSIIVTPLIRDGILKGILQISVPIKEKEFDYNSYNFVSTIGDVVAALI